MVYCDRYPTKPARGAAWDPTVASNTTAEITKLFRVNSDPERAVLFYCYAVMSCEAYLEAFEPVLYVPSNPERPFRVPVFADQTVRQKLVELGEKLAACENFDITHPLADSIEAIWPKEVVEFELVGHSFREAEGELELVGSCGERALVRGVSSAACTHRIAGHNVLDKWLRERRISYLRRTLRPNDLRDLMSVISRIERQLLLLQEIAALVSPLLRDPKLLVAPPKPE